ncbi:MAG: glycosyltransferase [Solirubrobacteraceae bacterium]
MKTGRSGIPQRDPAAPRLIEWIGERCVPWAPDPQMVYEHLHRYLWAAGLVVGRRVLDLASGEGFGAAILATTAASVIGVDIDPAAVEHSRSGYVGPNLRFEVADALDLSNLAEHGFEVVVAFELIEHLAKHETVIEQIGRVLAPGGLLIMSTPDRTEHTTVLERQSDVHQLDRDALHLLLASRFRHVKTFRQRAITGSAVSAVRNGNGDAAAATPDLISLASDAPVPALLEDRDAELERETLAETARALDRARDVLATQALDLARARRQVAGLAMRSAHDDAHVRALEAHAADLAAANEAREAALRAELHEAKWRLLRVDESVTWQLFQRRRAQLFALLGGEDSRGVAALQASLRFLGGQLHAGGARARMLPHSAAPPPPTPIRFASAEDPLVSIVIPVYSHAELTRGALESIRDNTPFPDYEVIVVDDSEDAETKALLDWLDGARIVVNERNLGYAKSVARGAALARGRWLVLCNNDIVVRPGWLDALLDCAESGPDIAIVTPKYLDQNGTLSEAGGLIWRDASGANYGRGHDPWSCQYEYRREVDYGSAAALLVRTDVWREQGGYDERFAPMYYEDADLCFRARAAGWRVLYEPRAEVVHLEGSTAGTDQAVGHKRLQSTNRPRFRDKWRDQLNRDHFDNDQSMSWLAASRLRGPNVLIVDHTVPRWDRDAGSLRMREILRALIGLGCHVTFLPDNLAPLQPYTRELQRLGVEVVYGTDPQAVLETIGPSLSLAILSRPQPAARWLDVIREHAPDATIAYDTVDLHWLREARRAAANAGQDGLVFSPKAVAIRELELAMMRAADVTVVVTDAEAARVREDLPDAVVHVLPIGNHMRGVVPPVADRSGLVFVGGFVHPPNVDAALVLAGDVMPLVWKAMPDAKLTIVGADVPPEVLRLAQSRVDVAGWVQDLDPLLCAARAMVAPLRYGAGLKGKVTQALAEGLPVVTTPIGAEGLDAVDGEQLLVGAGVEELAAQTIRILTDDQLWQRLSIGGQLLIADRGSPTVIVDRLRGLLDGAAVTA